jgi:hypothetical protein
LVEELESRGVMFDTTGKELLEKIYLLRRTGKPFDAEIDQMLWACLGKAI